MIAAQTMITGAVQVDMRGMRMSQGVIDIDNIASLIPHYDPLFGIAFISTPVVDER